MRGRNHCKSNGGSVAVEPCDCETETKTMQHIVNERPLRASHEKTAVFHNYS